MERLEGQAARREGLIRPQEHLRGCASWHPTQGYYQPLPCSSWPGADYHSLVLTNAFSGRAPLPQPQQECREGIGANVAATTAPLL